MLIMIFPLDMAMKWDVCTIMHTILGQTVRQRVSLLRCQWFWSGSSSWMCWALPEDGNDESSFISCIRDDLWWSMIQRNLTSVLGMCPISGFLPNTSHGDVFSAEHLKISEAFRKPTRHVPGVGKPQRCSRAHLGVVPPPWWGWIFFCLPWPQGKGEQIPIDVFDVPA